MVVIFCHTGRIYILMTQILDQFPQSYQTNTVWALLNEGVGIRSEMFENATFDYTEVTLTLSFQRHSAIYEATIVIPALGECVSVCCGFQKTPGTRCLFSETFDFVGNYSEVCLLPPSFRKIIILYFAQFSLC